MWARHWLQFWALGRKNPGVLPVLLPLALSLRWDGDLPLLECQPSSVGESSF